MERLRRVQQIWSWLPAFRAVAETEHLPTAAKALHVSASSLSRTVRLVEDDLGVALFRREGRRIVLDEPGRILLRRTRDAMRLVHEAILEVRGEEASGEVRVSSTGVATIAHVVPGLTQILAEHPGLDVQLVIVPAGEAAAALARGTIDVAFQSVPLTDPRVTVKLLGEATNGVYAVHTHPVFDHDPIELEHLAGHDFAAPPADALGRTWEGWPATVPRRIRMRISQMHVGIEAVAQGGLVGVFPDDMAGADRRLRRVPLDVVPPTPMFALTRPSVGVRDRAALVVDAVAARMG